MSSFSNGCQLHHAGANTQKRIALSPPWLEQVMNQGFESHTICDARLHRLYL